MSGYTDIEKLFIQEELDQHAEYLSDLFVEDIEKNKLIKHSWLLDTFTSGNPFTISYRGNQVILSVKFPDYGRFIEIQQRKPIKTETQKGNASKWGTKKKAKKKNTSWYTRNVYGSQNLLIGRLMYGLSDIERERLKNILQR